MRRVIRWLVVVLLLAGVVAYLSTGLTPVRPGERAVVRRFGRVLPERPGPGLWVGLPWGMDRVDRVSVDALRRVEVGYRPNQDEDPRVTPPGQLLTGDHNLVNVQVVVGYTVREADVADYVLQQDRADDLVARVAETVVAEWVAGRSVDDVLLHGRSDLRRVLVEESADRLEPYHLGVKVEQADVAYLFPPRQVKDAFDDVTRAQAEMQTAVNDAEQTAARRLREARAEKYRVEQLALAYAHEQRSRARAEAESFEKRLAQYRRLKAENPDFLRRVWLDEVGRLLGRLKDGGRLDLLDNHLSGDGLDLTLIQPPPRKDEGTRRGQPGP
jgi:membrane protease subunit HflK